MILQEKNKKILVIGSHPDDIEYSCAGTLIKLKEKYNCEIKCYILSFGSEGDQSSGVARVLETKEAFKLGRITENIIVQERFFPTSPNINEESDEIRHEILKFNPDLIFTHSPHDTHQEHIQTHQITITAARRLKLSILEYPMLSSTPAFMPNIFSDITPYFNRKKELLKKHKTQNEKTYMTDDFINTFNSSAYGLLHLCNNIENFYVHRLIF